MQEFFLVSGIFAALLARVVLGLITVSGSTRLMIVVLAPMVEETAKTGSALLLNADILYTHVIFGGIELVLDTRRRRGVWPGLAALTLHSVLGFVTRWLYQLNGSLAMSLAAAVLLHAAWNYTAVMLLGPRSEEGG